MKELFAQKHLIIAIAALATVSGAVYYGSDGRMEHGGIAPISIRALIDASIAQTCTFTSLSASTDTQGTVYVADGMMRGDFESTVKSASGGKVVRSHMIIDRTSTYIWSDVIPGMGMKMPKETLEGQKVKQGGTTRGAPLDIDQKLDYHCAPWAKNKLLLTPPREVAFQDMSAMMNGNTGVVPSGMGMPSGAGR